MAKKSVAPGKKLLDPMFYIPEGVDGFAYSEDETFEQNDSDSGDSSVSDSFGDDGYEDFSTLPFEDGPDTPEIIGIINPQRIRRTPSGQQVVDVIIEVTDVAAAANYEIRVTKI